MRPQLILAPLLLVLATMIGCKQKPGATERQATDSNSAGDESRNEGIRPPAQTPGSAAADRDDQPPPWPPLPDVPARPAAYPKTPAGRMAMALDDAADDLLSRGPPEKETPLQWPNVSVRRAFTGVGAAIAGYPKSQLDKETLAPAGDATRERDLLDRVFDRYVAAWACYWEKQRRWEILSGEVFLRRVMRKPSAKKLREEAERDPPPDARSRSTRPTHRTP